MPPFLRFSIGLVLTVLGIYLLSQNIIITTGRITTFQGDLLAVSSIVGLMVGVALLVFFQEQTDALGWIFIAIGLISVFLSGRVILKPTTLWYFLLSFTSLMAGLTLVRGGRIRF
ncbi:MAG: hypothetical protein HC841_02215 [Verrucomicrobiae bacterium]|nr:hypothetical protein [Verrucomicrobiae bacterium]